MILLNRGNTELVYLTLTEKTTLASPVYLFRFVHQVTKREVVFTSPDLSGYPERYNKFEIDVDSLFANEDDSHYYYFVYEQEGIGTDYQSSTSQVENGIALLKSEGAPVTVYEPSTQEYFTYER